MKMRDQFAGVEKAEKVSMESQSVKKMSQRLKLIAAVDILVVVVVSVRDIGSGCRNCVGTNITMTYCAQKLHACIGAAVVTCNAGLDARIIHQVGAFLTSPYGHTAGSVE